MCLFRYISSVFLLLIMAYIPKNILITGGCGFIGSNFINYIFHKWDKTNFINVDKLILNSDARYISDDVIFSGRYKLITCDIKNSIIIKQALVDNQVTSFSALNLSLIYITRMIYSIAMFSSLFDSHALKNIG